MNRTSRRRVPLVLGVVAAASAALADPALAASYLPGSTTGPDPYFPASGNGGYEADRYALHLDYTPATKHLRATADVQVTATQALSSMSLDLRDLSVSAVRVDGVPARWRKTGQELVVTLPQPLRRHEQATVTVDYAGTMGQPTDNTGALYGWVAFDDGALVANEADGAATWFPVNDTTSDKATFEYWVTVPRGKTAVANGRLLGSTSHSGRTTWHWRADDPMTPYLATATIGDFDLGFRRTRDGKPLVDAVDRDVADLPGTRAALAREPEILAWESSVFGPYPFEAAGGIVDDDSVGYALETQTRPVYSGGVDVSTIVHELAHQWYGDSVSPHRWADIWLNEGLATYAQWLWDEHTGGRTTRATFAETYAQPASADVWQVPVHDPGALDLFATSTYDRGAMTLQVLREAMGDRDFFQLLRRWAQQRGGETGSTAQFEALAGKLAHRDLSRLFHVWLDTTGKPAPGGW